MILFSEIFNRAVNLFDDPDIRQSYINNPAGYEIDMRPFLVNGLNKFTYPTEITDKLTQYSDPQGAQEVFNGDGSATYSLDTTPVNGSSFSYKIGDEFVQGEYNAENNTVTFPRAIEEDEECTVVWYFAGAFTADFSNILRGDFNRSAIMEKIKNILAHCILSAWGDNEMNRAIEFRNNFSDSDLGFYSPANSATAKKDWHNQINRDLDTLVVDLCWRIGSTPKGGSRFGK